MLADGGQFFPDAGNVHVDTPVVRMANVHRLPGDLSEEIKQLWRKPRGKRAYRITVDEYGAGNVILYLG